MMFQLVELLKTRRLVSISEEQVRKVEQLRYKEDKVEREMVRQQVAMANMRTVELARLASQERNGEAASELEGLVNVAMKVMLSGLEWVLKEVDCVRLKTLKGLLDLLRPLQSVKFLAVTCMVQIKLR
ncbi:protein DOG1-like 4 [Malus domestica]